MKNLNYGVSNETKDNFIKSAEFQIFSGQVNIVNLKNKIADTKDKKEKANLELQISALDTTMENNITILKIAENYEAYANE